MKTRRKILQIVLVLLVVVLTLPGRVYAAPDSDRTIEHLIAYVANSQLTFLRNGDKHTSHAAAEHIRRKYERLEGSITSPEEFIDKCASKSLLSGDEYEVILSDGSTKKVRDWLMDELEAFRRREIG